MALVGQFFGPGELVEFFVVEAAFLVGERVGYLEPDAAAGGRELPVGRAENLRAPAQDEMISFGVGVEDAFTGLPQGAG